MFNFWKKHQCAFEVTFEGEDWASDSKGKMSQHALLTTFFKLRYSWCTVLYKFQVYNTMIHNFFYGYWASSYGSGMTQEESLSLKSLHS